jgi:hypothetical protein
MGRSWFGRLAVFGPSKLRCRQILINERILVISLADGHDITKGRQVPKTQNDRHNYQGFRVFFFVDVGKTRKWSRGQILAIHGLDFGTWADLGRLADFVRLAGLDQASSGTGRF